METNKRYVNNFTDLEVYKLSKSLSQEIFELSKAWPKEETYSLTDQIRRSSRSVGVQIAEAWGKRRYEKHFISKLTDADGEQLETQHWIVTACDCSYLALESSEQLISKYAQLGRMLNAMMSKATVFCGSASVNAKK